VVLGGNFRDFFQESLLLAQVTNAVHKVPIDWTLIIEAKMSILMPIFIIIALVTYRYVLFFTFILLLFFDVGMYVLHFSMGIFIAKIFHLLTPTTWKTSKFYAYRYWGYALIAVLVAADQLYFIAIQKVDLHDSYTYYGFIAKGIGNALLLILIICSPNAQKFLENKYLVFLGKISYGIYVGHWFICVDIIETYYFASLQQFIGSYYLSHILIRYGLWTVASVAVGTILYYGVEQPFIKLGNTLITNLRKTTYWKYLS